MYPVRENVQAAPWRGASGGGGDGDGLRGVGVVTKT
jgi:hypothetical protein